jgi:hypothetical protein
MRKAMRRTLFALAVVFAIAWAWRLGYVHGESVTQNWYEKGRYEPEAERLACLGVYFDGACIRTGECMRLRRQDYKIEKISCPIQVEP